MNLRIYRTDFESLKGNNNEIYIFYSKMLYSFLKLRNRNRHNSLYEFNFTKIPAFTIQIFEVSKEDTLFHVKLNSLNLFLKMWI